MSLRPWQSVLAIVLAVIAGTQSKAGASPLPPLQRVDPRTSARDAGRLREVLAELERLNDPLVDPSTIAAAIEQKGPDWTPDLIRLMELGRPDERSLLLAERNVLLEAMASWGRMSVMPFVRERARLEGDARAWVALLLILGEVGSGSDLELAVEIGTKAPKGVRLPSNVGEAFREGAAKILNRDSRGMSSLRKLLLNSDPRIGSLLARSVGDTTSSRGAETLSRLLGFVPFSDRTLLESIGRAGRELPHPVDSSITDAVLLYLHSDDLGLVQEAALSLGALGDHDAIERLTALLDHPSLAIRSASYSALKQITGLGFSADSARWRSWYNLEAEWLETRLNGLLADLGSQDPALVAGAIREATSHLLQRPMLAREIEGLLERREPYLRALASKALGRIGGSAQLPALEIAANDPDEGVAAAAAQAVERLTSAMEALDSRTKNRRPTPRRRNPTSQRSRR